MTDFKNVILVTGATRGIGKSIACSLVCSDNYIVGTATSEQGAESITNYMKELKTNGIGRVLDVTNGESVKKSKSKIPIEVFVQKFQESLLSIMVIRALRAQLI